MRRAVVAEAAATRQFNLDERIFEDIATPPEQPVFRLDTDCEGEYYPPDPAPPAVDCNPRKAPSVRHYVTPSLWLSGAALLTGILIFVAGSGNIGSGLFARRSATIPGGAADGTGAHPLPAAKDIERIVIPAVPAPQPPHSVSDAPPPPAAPAATASSRAPADPATIVEAFPVPVMVAPFAGDEDDAWFSLASEYRQAGESDRAEEIYLRIIEEGVQRGRASLALGDLYLEKGDNQRAREYYLRSEQLYRDHGPQTSMQ